METKNNRWQPSEQLLLHKLVEPDTCGLALEDELCVVTRSFQAGELAGETRLALTGSKESGGVTWQTQTHFSPVSGRSGCFDLTVTAKLTSGEAKQTAVAISVNFSKWDRQAYVLMPGIVYAGNRFDIFPLPYAPLIRDKSQFRLDMPSHMTDQPHLNKDGTNGQVSLNTGHVATPAMGFYDASGRGFLLLTSQQGDRGNLGLTVEEDNKYGVGRFLVSTPQTRRRRVDWVKWDADLRDWEAGDCTTLKIRMWFFCAEKLQVLFDRFAECRKDLNPSRLENRFPFSAAAKLVREKWNARNWDNLGAFYAGDENHGKQQVNHWQLGWTSGGIVTQPFIQQGDEKTRERALRELEFILEKAPAPSGFIYACSDGVKFFNDGFGEPHPHNMTMVRRQGDALYYLVRQLIILQLQGHKTPALWQESTLKLAEAFIRLFNRYQQIGQFLDIETGELLIGGSTAGGIVPAGLALAAYYFDEPKFLTTAEALGRYFAKEALASGLTTGGPGEALAAPDSESSYALLKSFVTLYEHTGKAKWAKAAQDMTRQFATWVTSYDYHFPPDSPLGKNKIHATGSVIANTQNQHSSPGICTHSGDDLFRLWRATGDEFALELLRDIAHNITQYVSQKECPLGNLSPGMICERVNLSDWEGEAQIGGHLFGSCAWPEVALLLTAAEIPGVYVQTDTRRVVIFDHVEAELKDANGEVILQLTNPTAFDADVSVLAENTADAREPLGPDLLRLAQCVHVPAGKTSAIKIASQLRRKSYKSFATLGQA